MQTMSRIRSHDSFLLLLVCLLGTILPISHAFLHPPQSRARQTLRRNNFNNNNNEKEEEAILTDLDARVLQSMLQDSQNNLNLEDEQNMKKLLERGIQQKKKIPRNPTEDEEESEYSSSVLKALGDTKLWKRLSLNVQNYFDSAKIYVSNRVERDAKLLGSLGLFAFERAMQDVSRALPASVAEKVVPKTLMQLSSTSSFNKNETKTMSQAGRIRQDMATPLDEIKSVGEELKSIFNSDPNDKNNPKETTVGGGKGSRGLRSTATSKSGKQRFEKAFQRQQETTLKREKENIAQSLGRSANEIVDNAWQVKQQTETELNEPGYKTKAVREGAVTGAKTLAAGAKLGASALLGGAKRIANLLGQGGTDPTLRLDSTSSYNTETPKQPVVTPKRKTKKTANAIETQATISNVERTSRKDSPVNTRFPWVSSPEVEATTTTTTTQSTQQRSRRTLAELETLINSEIEVLQTRLKDCLVRPDQTWLNPDLMTLTTDTDESLEEMPSNTLETIVTLMVQSQTLLQTNPWETLGEVQDKLDQIILAARAQGTLGNIVANYLQQELGTGILQKLEAYEAEWMELEAAEAAEAKAREETTADYFINKTTNKTEDTSAGKSFAFFATQQSPAPQTAASEEKVPTPPKPSSNAPQREELSLQDLLSQWDAEDESEEEGDDDVIIATKFIDDEEDDTQPLSSRKDDPSSILSNAAMEAEVMDVIPNKMGPGAFNKQTLETQDEDFMLRVTAEIVTDDDFDECVGDTDTVRIVDDEEDEPQKPNPAVQFSLRSLDVVFLVLEKTVTAVPELVSRSGVVTSRLQDVQKDGKGSAGWKKLESAERGAKRY